jgi:hypothetical protein
MNKKILIVGFMFFLLLSLNLFAQTSDKLYGVTVGMRTYVAPTSVILNSRMTAEFVKTTLNSWQNWTNSNITILIDPTKTDIKNAVQAMPKNSDNVNFFYYCGHGTTDGMWMLDNNSHICPSTFQSYFGTFNRYAAYIDACYSGVFKDSMTTGFIGTSTTSSEESWGGDFSSYTPFGGGIGYGNYNLRSPIGTLTAQSLFNYARSYALARGGNNPQYVNNIGSDLLLTTAAYNVNLTNGFAGLSNQGTITVNNVSVTLPNNSIRYYQGTAVTVTASNQVVDGIQYTFNHWQDGSVSYTKTITSLTTDQTLTATFTGKPLPVTSFTFLNTTAGNNIQFSWVPNSNSHVDYYEIWRKVKRNGSTTTTLLVDNLSPSITSYTDNDYVYTDSYTDALLSYDVRPHYSYSTDNAFADPNYQNVYGAPDLSQQSDDKAIAKASENISIAPVEYSLGSYPNPFNPTTVIRYTMPEAGQVSLKVYNILSQEVANLVESNQSAGVHQVNFNASHLPTGIYIARLQAGAKVMTAKLQLVK